MKRIGGYFELELSKGKEFHEKAIRLNTGRNAFEYILRVKKYSKVFLPKYTCEVLLEPIRKLNINHQFYSIDENFYPILNLSSFKLDEALIYTNYFGICDDNVIKISRENINCIIDNAQAFYSSPLENLDSFYSPRKFFGVPDGAYLYIDKKIDYELEKDFSYKRFEHLLGRIDLDAENFYKSYKRNNSSLVGQEIKTMSNITQRILKSINYKKSLRIRHENFSYLHEELNKTNELKFNFVNDMGPMVYPYLVSNGKFLKKILIKHKIFVATYWPNILQIADKLSWEYYLADNLVSIPIDQRYTSKDLFRVLSLISNYLHSKS